MHLNIKICINIIHYIIQFSDSIFVACIFMVKVLLTALHSTTNMGAYSWEKLILPPQHLMATYTFLYKGRNL